MIYTAPTASQIISSAFIRETLGSLDDVLINIDNTVDNKIPNSGKIGYINNKKILTYYFKICSNVNKEAGWDLDIDSIQSLVYREYNTNYKSEWEVDQHDQLYKGNNLRKISFRIFLNNDFEGGEFDFDFLGPKNEQRFQTFNQTIPVNTALFFQSYNWHRIRTIDNGVKKEISGFVLGPKYK